MRTGGILLCMITRFEHQGVQWVDLESPTADEVDQIALEFNLSTLLSQDLLSPTYKSRVDLYPKVAYTVLHFPALRYSRGMTAAQEVDFVIGKSFLITAHYDTVPAIYDFIRSFEAESLLKHAPTMRFESGHVLLELTERLYQSVEDELESLEDTISSIENEMFSGHEKEMVVTISRAARELLNQKRTLTAHTDVLAGLEQIGVMTFGEAYGNYLRGVKSFHARVYAHAMALTETITELRETNMALLYTRQNEVMKNLTIMAFVTFPLALISSIFGMNTHYLPIVGAPGDFWIIVGSMTTLAILFFAYFKFKKWF